MKREEKVLESSKTHAGNTIDVNPAKLMLMVDRGYVLFTADGIKGTKSLFGSLEGSGIPFRDHSLGNIMEGAAGAELEPMIEGG